MDDPAAPATDPGTGRPAVDQHWWGPITDPLVLFPAIGVLVLAGVWAATFQLVRVEEEAARRAARDSAVELADTYEAQVLRALREIDHALKLVQHQRRAGAEGAVLTELRARSLLPPELLFTVSVADADGRIVAGTHAGDGDRAAELDAVRVHRDGDAFHAGQPWRDAGTGEWRLVFSRRLAGADGAFAGAVMVAVDAAYFVSGCEPRRLGARGALAVLGTDGVIRARRSGETAQAGGTVAYAAVVEAAAAEPAQAVEAVNPWDGVRRYTSARKLYGYPLAIVVGLAVDEQLAPVARRARTYYWRAAGISALAAALLALLGTLSRRLQQVRLRTLREEVEHAQHVEYLAYHDSLTGLPNRSYFGRLLTNSIASTRRFGRQLAVLFMDLDRFKFINDTLGHEAGDQLLQEVARRLKSALRESDTVARLGGDEFVVLLPEQGEESQLTAVARKILAGVGCPYVLAGEEVRITVSIGIAIYPRDGEDEQSLMKNADVAMYHAKEHGKNNFQFYSEALNATSLERLALESSLRRALDAGEFRLHYQARLDTRSGRVTGMEVLLRWEHPQLGLVLPQRFMPLAEESGLIVPIGRWVLENACRQAIAWQREGLPGVRLAVNLSPRQFLDEFLLRDVAAILAGTGLPPGLLELEITERMLMRNVEAAVAIMRELKGMDIRIALDDLGTGYSSLSTLKQFPLDTIKIDGSFIRDLAGDARNRGLTDAVIAVGRTLSLTVVAEGVETREQAEFLRQHACDEFQGYYLNRPMPAEAFTAMLRAQAGHGSSAPTGD